MVLQGAQDPRVLQVESDEIVANARANGVEVEYVVFEDEGHGFVKKENEIEGYGKVLEFLDTYLKNAEPATSGAAPADAEADAEDEEPDLALMLTAGDEGGLGEGEEEAFA